MDPQITTHPTPSNNVYQTATENTAYASPAYEQKSTLVHRKWWITKMWCQGSCAHGLGAIIHLDNY